MDNSEESTTKERATILEEMRVEERKKRFLMVGVLVAVILVALIAGAFAVSDKKKSSSQDQKSEVIYDGGSSAPSATSSSSPATTTSPGPSLEIATSGLSVRSLRGKDEVTAGVVVYNPSEYSALDITTTIQVKAADGDVVGSAKATQRSIPPKSTVPMSAKVTIQQGKSPQSIYAVAVASHSGNPEPAQFSFSGLSYSPSNGAVKGKLKNETPRALRNVQVQCIVTESGSPLGGGLGSVGEVAAGATSEFSLTDGLVADLKPSSVACHATGE